MANLQTRIENKITLSVDSPLRNRPSYISAKQLDVNSRFLRVTLVGENGVLRPMGLSQLNVKRPDDQEIFIPGTINDDGTISFALKSDVLALPGTVACDVSVFEADGDVLASLTSSTFHIIVAESMFSEDAWEGEDQGNIFTETITTMADLEAKARESAQSAKASETNAAASAAAVEQDKETVSSIKEDVETSAVTIKEDISTVSGLLTQAQEENQKALNTCQETKTYRDEAEEHANAAKDAAEAALQSERNAKDSENAASTHSSDALATEVRVNEAFTLASQKASEASESARQAAEKLESIQVVSEKVVQNAQIAQDKANAAEASAQNAASAEASAKGHADTIQETVDALADDYQAVIDEVADLKGKVMNATIDPNDLSLKYDGVSGYLYPVYMNVQSEHGWRIAESFDLATLEETQAYLNG